MAQRAWKAGEPLGGLSHYLGFINDPANNYLRGGKPDMTAYMALAARNVEQRQEQIEAFDGLAMAVSKANVAAALLLATYYYETSAPTNTARLQRLVEVLTTQGIKHPLLGLYRTQLSRYLPLGRSNAAVKQLIDTELLVISQVTAASERSRPGERCNQFKTKAIAAAQVESPEFLPVQSPLFASTYLLKGKWSETWLVEGCNRQATATIRFEADGWGGVRTTAMSVTSSP